MAGGKWQVTSGKWLQAKGTLRHLLIPRPHSFLINSLLFAAGLLFAWLEGYRIQANMPAWLFVLLWFVAQEVLVQQAKYMWNDIRDHDRDQKIPANRIRPIARSPLSRKLTVIMAGRWIVGLVLAAWLSPVLLTLLLMISGLQVLYELWAKPQAAIHPSLPMVVVGAGMVLKCCSGAMALGVPPGEQRMWFYGLAVFATGVVFISSFWRVEAEYFAGAGLEPPRGQSAYYAQKGIDWLKAGTAVTIAACTILIFDGYTHFLAQITMRTGLALGLIIAAGIVCCRFCFSLVQARWAIRIGAVAFFMIGSAAYALFRIEHLIPVSLETFAATLLLLVLLFDHRINVNLDYQQQNVIYLTENWPKLKRAIHERPSHASAIIHWRHLLRLALVLNTPNYEAERQRQQLDWLARGYISGADSPVRKREARGEGRTN